MPDNAIAAQVDPTAGLGMYQRILQMRQAQQNLQTGAYVQQQEQARARQEQIHANEMGAIRDVFANAPIGKDGNIDQNAVAESLARIAPNYGLPRAKELTDTHQAQIDLKKNYASLNGALQGQTRQMAGAWAADPKAPFSDLVKQMDEWANLNEDKVPEAKKVSDSSLRLMRDLPLDQQKAAAMEFARAGLGQESITGATGIATPQAASIDIGGSIQPGVRAPAIQGAGFTPTGAPLQKTITPSVVQSPAGPLARTTPQGGIVPLADTGQQPPVNITNPQRQAQLDQAKGVSDRVQQAVYQANSTVQAQDALTRAKSILEAPEAPNTGAGFERIKTFKNYLSSVGIDTSGADDMNSLTKNLARYEASRATAAGLGSTDAARELAHNGSPGVQLDNKSLQGIVNQSLATEKAIAAYAKVQSKTNDPQQMLKNETDFRSLPNVILAYEYGMTRNASEANALLHKHGITPAQMAESRKALKEFESR